MISHLHQEAWEEVNRRLIAKAIAEFTHERLFTPRYANGRFEIVAGPVVYRFAATHGPLDHWTVDPGSIVRHPAAAPDALQFVLDTREALEISDAVLPVYLEELSSSLAGMAFKDAKPDIPVAELVDAGFQTIETSMTEGHPCFVANNGRLGFGLEDYHRYAPEAARPVRLVWLAAHRDHSTFTSCEDTSYADLLAPELAFFAGDLPDDYHLFPVHPWQWDNKLSVTFAAELATGRLIHLGEGPDEHLAQQSIRTFFNLSQPARPYVKTAISVLNMGFTRGLSAAYMAATPAINDWLAGLISSDEVLKGTGLTILREQAAIGYHPAAYEAATDRYSPYRKMLAALWRESPVAGLEPGRRLATMASLLHVDRAGGSFAAELVRRSGLDPAVWLRRYLDAYLTPLLHSIYAYDLAFMPHGENVIMVLKDHAVERVIFKDIAEEIVVMSDFTEVPESAARIRADVPYEMRMLSIYTDVFDCFFRFLAVRLEPVLPTDDFWRVVSECVADYLATVPHLADRYDIFQPEFALSCLNRLQLRNNQQMVNLADPSEALQLVGTLRNPLAFSNASR
ncbi:IucA/IucC family protein [Actinoplanes sp. NPDC089786]|uniref:IucA/IucC family protein n=1 Tax=Actinoplanes sp. NPDC089786 TaxID=3155185 RepID=UPI0034323633